MLSQANFSIATAIRYLSELGISAAFVSPTSTGLQKNILDAHHSFRELLTRFGVHDFTLQAQGPEFKKLLPITLHSPTGTIDSKISLYRPNTKNGDPRLWIQQLGTFSKPTDLLAIWVDELKSLHAINFSSPSTISALDKQGGDFYNEIKGTLSNHGLSFASELLNKLKSINKQGFIESLRSGDTGVGFTLESLLGIQANSSKNPDYKGIEIKTKRLSAATRSNLFSQIPDWKLSSCKSGLDILNRVGYVDQERNRLALYVTVSSKPNAQGLRFELDEDYEKLQSVRETGNGTKEQINQWDVEVLKLRLLQKHAETFWVSAEKKVVNGKEHFLYSTVTHTVSPIAEYFGPLIEANVITMDYTLHLKANGQSRDHGYLFKIRPEDLPLLFPPPITYKLSE